MCAPDAVETRAKAGFSLVELVMALFVLAFGVLALATTTEPLVGPLSPSEVSFIYLDSLGDVTTNPTAVSQIEVTLRSTSNVVDKRGSPAADSLTTAIYQRN